MVRIRFIVTETFCSHTKSATGREMYNYGIDFPFIFQDIKASSTNCGTSGVEGGKTKMPQI
jgi:hypothetical protein